MSEESIEKMGTGDGPVESSAGSASNAETDAESDSGGKTKRRGFIRSRDSHLTKKELKQLQKDLDEYRERIRKLEHEVAEKTSKAEESYDSYIRLQAETENFKKRIQRELSESIRYATESLIIEVIPALNNFETALLAAEKVPETSNFAIGMEMILKQLMDVLKAKGVEQIAPEHEAFDPKLHSALEKVETDEYPEDHIVETIQKGYKLHDRVIQPASVKVAVSTSSSRGNVSQSAEGNSLKIPVEDLDSVNNDEGNDEK